MTISHVLNKATRIVSSYGQRYVTIGCVLAISAQFIEFDPLKIDAARLIVQQADGYTIETSIKRH